MKTCKANIARSFGFVRQDIVALNERIVALQMQVDACTHQIDLLKRRIPQTTPSKENKQYIASSKGTTAYVEGSFHANNIKKENRMIFNTKKQAVNAGYKIK